MHGGVPGQAVDRLMAALGIKSLIRPGKIGRLVHVIPDSGDTQLKQGRLFLPPNFSDRFREEVRETGFSRPDLANKVGGSIGSLYKAIGFDQPLEHRKIRVFFDPWIDDGHHLEALCGQTPNHLGRSGKIRSQGKHPVPIHVVDIQIKGITRKTAATKFPGHLLELLAGGVGIAALVISETPTGRQRDATGQFGIAFDHLGHCGTGKQVEVGGDGLG